MEVIKGTNQGQIKKTGLLSWGRWWHLVATGGQGRGSDTGLGWGQRQIWGFRSFFQGRRPAQLLLRPKILLLVPRLEYWCTGHLQMPLEDR